MVNGIIVFLDRVIFLILVERNCHLPPHFFFRLLFLSYTRKHFSLRFIEIRSTVHQHTIRAVFN